MVSSTNKIDHHDITEILSKVALNTITLTLNDFNKIAFHLYKWTLKRNVMGGMDGPEHVESRPDTRLNWC